MTRTIAVLGIHTGIGKTVASAVLAEGMDADYWKPVQAGIEERDAHLVKQLITNGNNRVHDEAILLSQPLSPHTAAAIDGIEVDFTKFTFPETEKILLVETAGGILSPMSATATMADFVTHFKMPAILISQNYLGGINHTLLSVEVLRARGIRLLGIVMNGIANESSETFITKYSKVPVIARIPHFDRLDSASIKAYAAEIKHSLLDIEF